jgi:hypothetical protein
MTLQTPSNARRPLPPPERRRPSNALQTPNYTYALQTPYIRQALPSADALQTACSLIASPLSMVVVAAPGHGSLRGRNNPPQHLVRSTGAAMSTTSWHTITPLKAHFRSHPYPRPAGNHYIRNLARMNLTNNGVRRRLRAPTSGTAVPNARHCAG